MRLQQGDFMIDLTTLFKFDFSEWSELANSDPDAFEQRRQEAIEQTIQAMPVDKQKRIRGLQWRIDQERQMAKSPMATCIKLSNMMWEQVLGDNGLINSIKNIEKQPAQPVLNHKNNLLQFPSHF